MRVQGRIDMLRSEGSLLLALVYGFRCPVRLSSEDELAKCEEHKSELAKKIMGSSVSF